MIMLINLFRPKLLRVAMALLLFFPNQKTQIGLSLLGKYFRNYYVAFDQDTLSAYLNANSTVTHTVRCSLFIH